MKAFFALCFGFWLAVSSLPTEVNALFPSVKKNLESQSVEDKPKDYKSEREILGDEDTFPFLPDNHRDSGTGKFMAFD